MLRVKTISKLELTVKYFNEDAKSFFSNLINYRVFLIQYCVHSANKQTVRSTRGCSYTIECAIKPLHARRHRLYYSMFRSGLL